jgi:streptogramin lyase
VPSDANCDDEVDCTDDACVVGQGCVHEPVNTSCDDGIACTADICDVETGCVSRPDNERCADNNSCTTNLCDVETRSCISGARDEDQDGEIDLACGGTDCDDTNGRRGQNAPEVCNEIDDDCDNEIDEGVLSACDNCDSSCFGADFGVGENETAFPEEGMFGVAIDEERGGLIAEAFTRRFNYLWVTNTGESTVSRWDADTATEVGRYKVGLPEGECLGVCCWSSRCNMPSRVGVDGRGDAYIASRGFGMQGTVTKVAASIEDCVDRNNNGMIDTSIDATPLGFDEDECVVWTVPVGPSNAVLRGLAIDLGDDTRPEGYVWAGGYNERKWWKVDPRDGAVLAEVEVPVAPYGGVVTADGKLWTGILSGNGTAYVDTRDNTPSELILFPSALRNNCRGSYGITADGLGRVWFTGWNCRDSIGYDPEEDAWTRIDTTGYGNSAGRGITVDSNNNLWMAMEGGGRSHIVTWSSEDFIPNGVVPQAQTRLFTTPQGHTGPSGVGVDANGLVWLAHHQSSQLVRFNPQNEVFESFTGPNRVYTYSDFTGGVRRTIAGEGLFQLDFEAECDRPDWDELSWDAETPEGTRLVITGATANTDPDLQMARVLPFAIQPGDSSPVNINEVLRNQGEVPLKHLRVSFNLEVNEEGVSPVLRDFSLKWFCK